MRLAKHVPPKVNESLVGFLMRAAEANHMPNISALYALLGRKSRPPSIEDAERLAEFCGCTPSEIAQLFGFQVRRQEGRQVWRLGSEWITMQGFVSSRTMAVCRDCLRENPFLPGMWELTFYCCCASHRTRLLTVCQGCGNQLRWTRPKVWQCGCGFDLRNANTETGTTSAWITAMLIERRVDTSFQINIPAKISRNIADRLSGLSLDGLFKTIWLLGHCIGDFESCTSGHGRLKRLNNHAEKIVETAFSMLARWPKSLQERLEAITKKQGAGNKPRLYRDIFGPIVSYLEQEPAEGELSLIRLAYEQEIRRIWRMRGRKLPRQLDYQMELDIGN